MDLNELFITVDDAIEKMGINPGDAKNAGEGQWFLMNEDMPIYLDAWAEKESNPWNYFKFETDPTIFQITVPFCYGPTLKKVEFFEELLTVNLNLQYGKFSYNPAENIVALVFRQPGSSIQSQAIRDVIDSLGYYAEMTYHVLKDEFNLKRVAVEDTENTA
jgi:hypothetical protein